jgi:hypothetical protein
LRRPLWRAILDHEPENFRVEIVIECEVRGTRSQTRRNSPTSSGWPTW